MPKGAASQIDIGCMRAIVPTAPSNAQTPVTWGGAQAASRGAAQPQRDSSYAGALKNNRGEPSQQKTKVATPTNATQEVPQKQTNGVGPTQNATQEVQQTQPNEVTTPRSATPEAAGDKLQKIKPRRKGRGRGNGSRASRGDIRTLEQIATAHQARLDSAKEERLEQALAAPQQRLRQSQQQIMGLQNGLQVQTQNENRAPVAHKSPLEAPPGGAIATTIPKPVSDTDTTGLKSLSLTDTENKNDKPPHRPATRWPKILDGIISSEIVSLRQQKPKRRSKRVRSSKRIGPIEWSSTNNWACNVMQRVELLQNPDSTTMAKKLQEHGQAVFRNKGAKSLSTQTKRYAYQRWSSPADISQKLSEHYMTRGRTGTG